MGTASGAAGFRRAAAAGHLRDGVLTESLPGIIKSSPLLSALWGTYRPPFFFGSCWPAEQDIHRPIRMYRPLHQPGRCAHTPNILGCLGLGIIFEGAKLQLGRDTSKYQLADQNS